MISEVIIPELGATGGDVTLEAWLVEPGDTVAAGQPLFVLTTDKATVEVEAFRDGVVLALRAGPGAVLQPGSIVALLGDSLDERAGLPGESTARAAEEPPVASQQAATRADATIPGKTSRPGHVQPGGRILASPLARRIAEQAGLDLASLAGSGNQGQILKRDVISALRSPAAALSPSRTTPTRRKPLSPMRRAIAERVVQSKRDAPHFYATITVDMSAAQELRRQAAELADEQGLSAPSITDLCVRATALTLREYPALNASFDGGGILVYPDINVGLVVGLEEGMLIPVLHHADRLDLYALAAATRQLKERAEAGRLSASELNGGTFTLSNLGMFGLDSFTAVLNPPQAGILALGAVLERPAVVAGAIIPRPLMIATLSVDHRAVDGITCARFMSRFKQLLENPFRLALAGRPEREA